MQSKNLKGFPLLNFTVYTLDIVPFLSLFLPAHCICNCGTGVFLKITNKKKSYLKKKHVKISQKTVKMFKSHDPSSKQPSDYLRMSRWFEFMDSRMRVSEQVCA